MKAKMKAGEKPPEPAEYQCQQCKNRFKPSGAELVCPQCGNRKVNELVPIYLENDSEEEQMYSEADWHGGD